MCPSVSQTTLLKTASLPEYPTAARLLFRLFMQERLRILRPCPFRMACAAVIWYNAWRGTLCAVHQGEKT